MSEYTRRHFLWAMGIGTSVLMMPRFIRASGNRRRANIIIIIGDDIGYSDFGCYGGEIQTPHIDRIAANGIRMIRADVEHEK